VVEVFVAGEEGEPVLDRKRCDPNVVGGDWGTSLMQAHQQVGVKMRCGFVSECDLDAGPLQERGKLALVGHQPRAAPESGTEFAQNDERENDPIRGCHDLDRRSVIASEVDVSIRIEGDG